MNKILFGTDLSHESLCAAKWTAAFARHLDEQGYAGSIVCVHIASPESLVGLGGPKGGIRGLKDEVAQWLEEVSFPGEVEILIRSGSPSKEIPDLVEELDVDFLILGQTGKGSLAKVFLGTTAEKIALRPTCTTILVKEEPFNWSGPLSILACIDGEESSYDAAVLGAKFFAPFGLEVTLAKVLTLPKMGTGLIDAPSLPAALKDELDQMENQARREIKERWNALTSELEISTAIELRPGYPTHELLAMIEEKRPSLVTLGSNRRSALSRFFLGSVGHGLIRQAPTTFLIEPGKLTETLE